jgi:ppGpp synthetase/RelA/SpoT-type nucleotidyltranferase
MMSAGGGFEGKLKPSKRYELEGLKEKDVISPVDKALSPMDKVKKLIALSNENIPSVRSFIENLDEKFGTKSTFNVKDVEEILGKPSRKVGDRTWYDIEHLRDVLRFRTSVENLDVLPKICKELQKSGFKLVEEDLDRLTSPKGNGYRMAVFDLRAPNGQLIEFQIVTKEMLAANAEEHAMYKKFRKVSVKELSPKEYLEKQEAKADAVTLYRKAHGTYVTRTGHTDKIIKVIIKEARQTLSDGM